MAAMSVAGRHIVGALYVPSSFQTPQRSNFEASADSQTSTSGRSCPSRHGGFKATSFQKVSSNWQRKLCSTTLSSLRDSFLHSNMYKEAKCGCNQALGRRPFRQTIREQRRELLAWCIAALVGGQVGVACALEGGSQPGVRASTAVGQQQSVKGPVGVNVVPQWARVDAGHIKEDGGYPPTVVAAPGRRVVATGDFHGDLQAARRALELAGVLSSPVHCAAPDRWVGGSTVFVQVGDILDRGDDEIAIMSLLAHLARQASPAGGALYQVCGNHETMNVYGDFRYVTPGAFKEGELFDRWAQETYNGDHFAAFKNWYKEAPIVKEKFKKSATASWNPLLANKPKKIRQHLFEPGGPLARVMAGYSAVLQVNDSIFAHGGVLPHHVEYGLAKLNREVSRWMLGHEDPRTGEPQEPFLATRGFDSVMWSRLYSRAEYETGVERDQACRTLSKTLRMIPDAKRLIVGHTPQEIGANSECNGRIWRIDVGMSSGILQATPQVLEISGDDVRVLSEENVDLWVASYI